MRNALLVLAALAAVGCGHAAVQGRSMPANGAMGPAMGVAVAPQGAGAVVHPRSTTPMPRGVAAAVNHYRGTTEPAKLRPCKIQITSDMQRRMSGQGGPNHGPKWRIREISVPCSTRCPGQRHSGPPTQQTGPRPGH